MTCTEFERLLDEREPDAQITAEMQRHAAECGHCRLLLELRTLDREEEVPQEAAARWRAALRTEQAKAGTMPAGGKWTGWRLVAPLAAVAAVLVAAIALRLPIRQTEMPQLSSAPAAGITGEAAETPVMAAKLMATGMPRREEASRESADAATNVVFDASVEDSAPAEGNAFEAPMETYEMETYAMEETAEAAVETADAVSLMQNEAPVLYAAPAGAGTLTLAWTAENAVETAGALLEALDLPASDAAAEQEGVRLDLTVRREEWPAFRAALIAAGCADAPEEGEIAWNSSGSIRLTLMIDERKAEE